MQIITYPDKSKMLKVQCKLQELVCKISFPENQCIRFLNSGFSVIFLSSMHRRQKPWQLTDGLWIPAGTEKDVLHLKSCKKERPHIKFKKCHLDSITSQELDDYSKFDHLVDKKKLRNDFSSMSNSDFYVDFTNLEIAWLQNQNFIFFRNMTQKECVYDLFLAYDF